MENEIFKDIPSYEGFYQVSNLGNVRSCDRIDMKGRFRKSQMMAKTLRHGYATVKLSKDGVYKRCLVHRLVAMAFIPNTDNKPFIDHKNAIRNDNRVENLRWCTALENVQYCMEADRMNPTFNDVRNGARKVAKLDLNGNEICVYPSLGEAHRQNPKATTSKISAVCRGERQKAGGFKWEFRSNEMESMKKVSHLGIAKSIIQYDSNMNEITEYISVVECHRITKLSIYCIRKSLREGVKTWNGYYFKYKNE